MLHVKLKANKDTCALDIEEYVLTFPFSLYAENNEGYDIYWNLNSIKCKNIKDSFRLIYCYKIDFTNEKKQEKNITFTHFNTKIDRPSSVVASNLEKQCVLFPKVNLFYINEKDVSGSLFNNKKKFPSLLLKTEYDALKSLQFFMVYNKDDNTYANCDNEEIDFFLNLYNK